MPEIVSDNDPFQMPASAANEFYSRKTNPGIGAFAASTLADAPTAFLGRAAERGTAEGASFFDRFLASTGNRDPEAEMFGAPPGPTLSAEIPPEQYNEKYAPRDSTGAVVPIGDKPMPEALAAIIGRQKTEAMQRDSVLSRFAETHAGVTTFAAGAAASMLDPLNAASMFLPGVGEGAIAAQLGGGLAGRTAARLLAGGATGALMQAPVSGLKMGLAPEEASDYGMRDAMRDILYGAAGMAVLHTGLGTARELLGPRAPEVAPSPRVPDAATQNVTMGAAIGEIAEGRPIDVRPVAEAVSANTPEALLSREPQRPPDIIDFLMRQGGVQDDGGELRAMDLHRPQQGKFGTLVRRNGLELDYARESAVEAGYLPEGATVNDLLNALRDTSQGRPVFIPGQELEWRAAEQARRAGPQPDAFDPNEMFAGIADDQRSIYRDGYAPGVSQDELAQANEAVYGPKPAETAPAAPTAELGANPELAAAEQHIAQIPPENLHPEDAAALASAAEGMTQAETLKGAFQNAAACLMGLV
jgi:hypothetical protein